MNYGCDEYWEERRKRLARARRKAAWREMLATFVYAVLAVAAICGVMWLAYWAANRDTFERAAYNQGRYGVSRSEAWRLAKEGVGLTAAEVCGNEEWRTDSACAALGAGGRGHAGRVTLPSGEVCHD